MTNPADLAKMMQSLKLDPDAAKIFAALREQNASLAARNSELEDEVLHLRKTTVMHTEMQVQQREKIQNLKEELKAQEMELSIAISANEGYKIEIDRLERYVDVDLVEADEANMKKMKDLIEGIKVLRTRIKESEADSDVEMGDDSDNAKRICPSLAVTGECSYGHNCRKGRHPAVMVAETEGEKTG